MKRVIDSPSVYFFPFLIKSNDDSNMERPLETVHRINQSQLRKKIKIVNVYIYAPAIADEIDHILENNIT